MPDALTPPSESATEAATSVPQGESDSAARGDRRARMYRREALDYHVGARHEAHLLELSPNWTQRTYWAVLAACTLALFFVSVAQVHEYASGLALIHTEGRTYVTARSAGTLETVIVRPGQRVAVGQMLARFNAQGETAELRRIDREIEFQLVKLLRNLEDATSRSALTTLRAERERAQALLAERTVYAPQAGVVSDVRAHAGQQLDPGAFILSVVEESAQTHVTAMLPGKYRPLLRPGMPMRLEIVGYPYTYAMVTLETVSDEVVSPSEARRFLRQPVADLVTSMDPVIFVVARLPSRTFSVDGQSLKFYDGMQANAEVAVRSESILLTLVPGLRVLWGGNQGTHD